MLKVIIGTPVATTIPFWRMLEGYDGVMFNAYDIMRKKGLLAKIERAGGIKEFFGVKGEVWIDSGGYQLMKREIPINVRRVAEVYKALNANVYISLDRPTLPSDDSWTRRQKTSFNMRNFEELKAEFGDSIVPVIHYSPDLRDYERLVEFYVDEHKAKTVAFGGFVPPLMHIKGSRGARLKALLSLIYLRKLVNKAKVHVMGAGAPTMIPIISAANADSTDSSTWRVKAAYGKIMLPWGGERHASPRKADFGGKAVSRSELARIFELIRRDGFPFASFSSVDELREYLASKFEHRALYNLWVTLKYVRDKPPKSPLFRSLYFTAKILSRMDAGEIFELWEKLERADVPSLDVLLRLIGVEKKELAEIAVSVR